MDNKPCCEQTDSLTPLQGQALRSLARVKGQVGGVQRLIQERSYCVDVLNQIHAARSALDSVAVLLMENHLETCCTEAIRSDDPDLASARIKEFAETVRRFVK
ncbi:metal-sensitive transcriptional regulator [bacterium]|nr:metal-sensitive transcriptional regulator [bacterium]